MTLPRLPPHMLRAALAATAVLALLLAAMLGDWYTALRERAFDHALSVLLPPAQSRAVVVDIDRESIAALGPWPWPRERLATLVERIAAAGPKALAIDIVVTGEDTRSPAALARKLAADTGDASLLALADRLADGDKALAAALARLPAVLGAALDPEQDERLTRLSPVLIPADIALTGLWQAAGVVAASPALQSAAKASGVVAMPGDADAAVRRVPLLTVAGSQVVAGLAVEALRIAEGSPPLVLTGDGRLLIVGSRRLRFQSDGLLRLRPTVEAWSQQRTVSAAQLLIDPGLRARLAGRIVVLGSSSPETGGLRPTAGDRLEASVQLQAQAIDQLLADLLPVRPGWVGVVEGLGLVFGGLAAALAGAWWRPVRAGVATAVGALAWIGLAAIALRLGHLLVDPIAVPLAAALAFAASALVTAAATAQREALIRRRFEQHLAPAVVSRIVEQPELLKLGGELREVTALFTDVEGFTAMTERSDPQVLVSVLDRYFERVCQIIVDAGGMVDKIVGDGVHAIFNAPFDLDDHAGAAVRAGSLILAETDRFCSEPDAKAIGFGRTRIGIETGRAVVGDVGGGRKLDYTAHGDAVNAAARLEAANKQLGSRICIGGGTAARLADGALRPMGAIPVRGRGQDLSVYDIWPASYGAEARSGYLAAASIAANDPQRAAVLLAAFTVQPSSGEWDPVPAGWIERLAAKRDQVGSAVPGPAA